MLYKCSELD